MPFLFHFRVLEGVTRLHLFRFLFFLPLRIAVLLLLLLFFALLEDGVFDFRQIMIDKVFLLFLLRFLLGLRIVVPLKIIVLFEKGQEEASAVLVVGQHPHGMVQLHFLSLGKGRWEHRFFDLLVRFHIGKAVEYHKLLHLLHSSLLLGLHCLLSTNLPGEHPSSGPDFIEVVDVDDLEPLRYLLEEGGQDGLVLDGVEGAGAVYDEPSPFEEVDRFHEDCQLEGVQCHSVRGVPFGPLDGKLAGGPIPRARHVAEDLVKLELLLDVVDLAGV